MRKIQRLWALVSIMISLTTAGFAQEPAKPNNKKSVAPQAVSGSVTGSGSAGQISKWTGVDGSNTYSLGSSNIFEDKFGKVGIGTRTPTSPLTVQGMIEATLGGFKFPDGTVQATAGISSVTHDTSLTGNGVAASPLGIATGGVNTNHLASNAVTASKIANSTVVRSMNGLFDNVQFTAGTNITITPSGNTLTVAASNALTTVAHDNTLAGDGTPASPLGVAVSTEEPFQKEVNLPVPSNASNGTATFTVPANKRLVIEFIAVRYNLFTMGILLSDLQIKTSCGGQTATYTLVPIRTHTGGIDVWVASQQVIIRADPDSTVTLFVGFPSQLTNGAAGFFSLSGRLINVP